MLPQKGLVLIYRDTLSFLITMFIYAGLGYLFATLSDIQTVSAKVSPQKTIELSLQAYQPRIQKTLPKQAVEEPVQEKSIPKATPPEEKNEPKKDLTPPPPKVEEPKPLPKVEPKKCQCKVKKHRKKAVHKSALSPQSNAMQSSKNQQSTAEAKNLFLANIRERIAKNKTYPVIAKRRGLQGSVDVSFTILANGEVSDIVLSGSTAFYDSAKNAVQKAFPVSVKNAPIALPERVSFTMVYHLK